MVSASPATPVQRTADGITFSVRLTSVAARECWLCPYAGPDVATYTNGWDGEADIDLCPRCAGEEPDACAEHRAGCGDSHIVGEVR